MGDGMKRAVLAGLVSRAPWQTKDGPLTADMLLSVYAAIVAGERVLNRGDRRIDRALQLLRKAALVEYAGKPARWVPRG